MTVTGHKSYVPVGKEILKDKDYNALGRALMDCYSFNVKSEDGKVARFIQKRRVKNILRDTLGMQSRKVNRVIDKYLDVGVLVESDDEHYKVPMLKPFTVIPQELLKFFIGRKDIEFKVYSILLYYYRYVGEASKYTFSLSGKNGLIGRCGYSDCSRNKSLFKEVLEDLGTNGLVKVSEPEGHRGMSGEYQGYYMSLLNVSVKPKVVTCDIEELIETLGKGFIPTQPQKEEIMEDVDLMKLFIERCV